MAHKAVRNFMGSLIQKRWNHSPVALVLPEFENTPKTVIPHLPSGASMELMAVPKKKVSPHKRGIRNGPKALKPVPVIVRCKSCGRVKLPHFYCCSGDRGSNERNNSPS
ncbi:hypothetical protein MRB53_021064 [Persea americana]|uniref:Uncharacterized protein n=1 Tax=Persea americana TaxID=3435 RepID=A0ACC2L319_PERAE|nr:hypothetical protein MRB53_021064 [Persea americana]|eukprot:TRINITY_DN788_c0_g1_i1.p1 TRINITY_DN788_c0_g1~~TRINITY_DN788_c0_g1_i1.p1  ORF type:complete len:109 (+),score=15.87 TRINITY_DN788_c0_g1_i1:302-628(+)